MVVVEGIHPHPFATIVVVVVVVIRLVIAGRWRFQQGQPEIQILLVGGYAHQPVQVLHDLAEGGPFLGPVVPALAHE